VLKRLGRVLGIALAISVLSSCKTTPEYIYIKPECSPAPRLVLPEIDSGKLYSALVLPHSLHPQDLSTLAPELLNGYDGEDLYYDLVNRDKLMTDMILENEAIIKSVCKKVDNG
jgi:hypothetical protein